MKRITLAISLVAVLFGGCELPEELNGSEKSSQLKTTGENSNLNDRNLTQEMIDSGNVPQRPGGQSSQQDQQIDQSELDFTVRGSCATYFDIFDIYQSWSWSYGTAADYTRVSIVDDSGETVETIKPDDSYVANSKIMNLVKSKSDLQTLLRSHPNENLLMKCVYKDEKQDKAMVFHSFIPLQNSEVWKKTIRYPSYAKPSNDLLLYTSILSDLRYKIYLENYKHYHDKNIALQKSDAFMQSQFPDTHYKEESFIHNRDMWGYASKIGGKKSPQASTYRLLNDLAFTYTGKRVDLLNDIIADNYRQFYLEGKSCSENWVCSTFFKESIYPLIEDPAFHHGLAYWQKEESYNSRSTGSISSTLISAHPKKSNIDIKMKSSHGSSYDPAMVGIYQTYRVQSGENLDNLSLKIKSKSMYGGCKAFAGCFSSGFAAYFACFYDGADNRKGCMYVSDFTDTITLPILVGEMFKVESTADSYILPGKREPFEKSFNIGKVIEEHLPSVKESREEIAYIKVGAFVGEATGSDGVCVKCEGSLEAEEISLEKLR